MYWRTTRRICTLAFLIFVSSISIALLTHPFWLPGLYSYLDVSQSPQNADVLIVLGGAANRRANHAVVLYTQGSAPRVILSGHADGDVYHALRLIQDHVPEEAILINDQATNTHDEAEQVMEIMLEIDARSALIVTDRFHTRRALATFQHVFSGHDIELTMVAPENDFDPTSWWQSRRSKQIAVEYPKMVHYWFVYGIWSG